MIAGMGLPLILAGAGAAAAFLIKKRQVAFAPITKVQPGGSNPQASAYVPYQVIVKFKAGLGTPAEELFEILLKPALPELKLSKSGPLVGEGPHIFYTVLDPLVAVQKIKTQMIVEYASPNYNYAMSVLSGEMQMPYAMQHSMRATDADPSGLLGELRMPYAMQHSMRATDASPAGLLGELVSPAGAQWIREAMDEDPNVAPAINRLLDSWDPAEAISRQVQTDLNEAIQPSGKKIVFKNLVRKLAPRVGRAMNAIVKGMPYQKTYTGDTAFNLLSSRDPEKALSDFYSLIALESLESENSDGLLGQLPFPRSVLAQQQEMQLAAARAASAPAPAAQIAAAQTSVVAPAVANAVNNINIAVGDGIKSAFKPTTAAPSPQIVYQQVPQYVPQFAPQQMYMPEYQAAPPPPATVLTPTGYGDGASALSVAAPGDKKETSLVPLAIAAAAVFMQHKK